MRNISRLKFSL